MGRKQSRLTGLSFFAKNAFTIEKNESDDVASSAPSEVAGSSTATRKASEAELGQDNVSHPAKKRKVGLLGPIGNEKYDATGLVPHYTDPAEVPDRLRKCNSKL